ncbi:MAG: type III-B CRISPR module RAMP protein Cmr6 [Crenarchaeota archaeon]|nr:type III-B CRISPR module RAMP protein Cmr6 [Thermoproteota archaeon]
MRRESHSTSPVSALIDEIVNKVNISELSNVNVESWLRLQSLRYLASRGSARRKIRYRGRILDLERDFKRSLLRDICLEAYRCDSPELSRLFERARNMIDAVKEGLRNCGYEVMEVRVKTKTRMLIGLSEEMFGRAIFEVGLMWDPYLNLPYIPGSSLKGAFRAYLELRGVRVQEHEVEDLLGTQAHASNIVFVNSYPEDCKDKYLLIPEVTTPIYSEIEGKIQESKAQPVPVIYPAVNSGVIFRIIVGIKRTYEKDERMKLLKTELLNFLIETLRQGIGAKTMLGYGILDQL